MLAARQVPFRLWAERRVGARSRALRVRPRGVARRGGVVSACRDCDGPGMAAGALAAWLPWVSAPRRGHPGQPCLRNRPPLLPLPTDCELQHRGIEIAQQSRAFRQRRMCALRSTSPSSWGWSGRPGKRRVSPVAVTRCRQYRLRETRSAAPGRITTKERGQSQGARPAPVPTTSFS